MDVPQALQQARSRNADQKAAAVAALGAVARTGLPPQQLEALQLVEARDRQLLHKVAHDVSKRELCVDAADALAVAVCGALSAAPERDAASQLLRKHSYQLGFEGRSTAQLAPAVPLLLSMLANPATSPVGMREAAGSLMNLAWRSPEHAHSMVSGGAFRVLVSVLNSDSAGSDASLLDNAAGAVLNILSHGSINAACEAASAGVIDTVTARLLSAGKNKWSRFGAKIVDCVARPAAEAALRRSSAYTSTSADSSAAQSEASAVSTIAAAFAAGGEVVRFLTQLCADAATAQETRCCALRALGSAVAAEAALAAESESAARDATARLGAPDPPLQILLDVLALGSTKTPADLRLAATECFAGLSCNPVAVTAWFKVNGLCNNVVEALAAQLMVDATLGTSACPIKPFGISSVTQAPSEMLMSIRRRWRMCASWCKL